MNRLARLRSLLVLGLVAVLASLSLAACESEAPAAPVGGHPTTLAGTSWVVSAVGGVRPPAGGEPPTMAFDGSEVQGSSGCNHYSGRYAYVPTTGELRFDELGMTAMACADPARNAFETRFTLAIGQPILVVSQADPGHLVLTSAAGQRIDLDVLGPAVTG